MATLKRTREINVFRVMRAVWLSGTISRVEIARSLRLDKSTITNIVSELLALGLVEEVAVGEAGPQGGRKPVFLTVNKNFGCVVGIEIQPESYSVVAVNMHGEVLYSSKGSRLASGANLAPLFLEILEKTLGELSSLQVPVIGVGVGVSGVVNQHEGKILYSIPLGLLREFDFLEAIAGKVSMPVLIENDANCCAWSELAFHRTERLRNLLFALVEFRKGRTSHDSYKGIAVGLGIMINGRVYYGQDYSAGEFRSVLWKDGNAGQFSLTDGEMLAVERDRTILRRFVRELAKNLAMVVNTFDLNQLYIGGDIEKYRDEVEPVLVEEIRRNWSYPTEVTCRVSFSSLGEMAVAYGAAGMFLGQLFAPNFPPEPDDSEAIRGSELMSLLFSRSL